MHCAMLDLRYVVENMDSVKASLASRSDAEAALLEPISALDEQRRSLILEQEAKSARRNAASKEMGKLDKKSPEFAERRGELKQLSAEVKQLEQRLNEIKQQLNDQLARIPNLPASDVPAGRSADDNREVSRWGEPRKRDLEVKPHYDVGVELGILDFERASKLSGPRFTVMMGAGARLERALIGFMLDLHTGEHGYTEVLPPFMVKGDTLFGTGQLPKFESDLFKTSKSDPDKSYDLYLSPTAEVTLTNLHAKEILENDKVPLAYAGYTPCFRSEAGSYGQDVRGMIRQHQFDKVELVRVCRPDESADQLEQLTRHAETVLEKLGLHYRRMLLCTGDMGFGSVKTYDLEVWLPAQNTYREISSCSNFEDFQARRMLARHRSGNQKPQLLHTLNGSGLAVGRTLVAVLENYQQQDGSVKVPSCLLPYMGGLESI